MSRRVGARWERTAERFLTEQGLKLVKRNFCCRLGEIDLVMLSDNTLIVVEVRYRSRNSRINALESVGPAKQRRLCRAAGYFLSGAPRFRDCEVRFDVVAITGDKRRTRVNWHPAAFDCDEH